MRTNSYLMRVLGMLIIAALPLTGCVMGNVKPKKDQITITSNCYWLPGAELPNRVAVLDFEGQRFAGGFAGGHALTDIMIMHLLKAGFTVLERDHLQDVLHELQIGEEGYQDLSDVEKAQKLGSVLNAQAIVTGKLLRKDAPGAFKASGGNDRLAFLNGNIELAARAIDVQTGEIIWMITINVVVESKTGQVIRVMDYLNEACAETVYSLKNPDYVNKSSAIFKEKKAIEALRASRR